MPHKSQQARRDYLNAWRARHPKQVAAYNRAYHATSDAKAKRNQRERTQRWRAFQAKWRAEQAGNAQVAA